MCINTQYLFFSFWFTSLCKTGYRFIHLTRTDTNCSFSWLNNLPLYICITQLYYVCVLVDYISTDHGLGIHIARLQIPWHNINIHDINDKTQAAFFSFNIAVWSFVLYCNIYLRIFIFHFPKLILYIILLVYTCFYCVIKIDHAYRFLSY